MRLITFPTEDGAEVKRVCAALLTVIAVTLSSGINASGASADSGAATSTTQTNASCAAAVSSARARGYFDIPAGMCTTVVTTSVGPATVVTAAALKGAVSRLSTDEYSALSKALSAGTVKSKTYSLTMHQLTDQETQKGTFFYDGTQAWVTASHRGFSGLHTCSVDYAGIYSVTNTGCSDTGSLTSRKLQMNWNVSVAFKGGPVSWGESFTMHVSASGAISNG